MILFALELGNFNSIVCSKLVLPFLIAPGIGMIGVSPGAGIELAYVSHKRTVHVLKTNVVGRRSDVFSAYDDVGLLGPFIPLISVKVLGGIINFYRMPRESVSR